MHQSNFPSTYEGLMEVLGILRGPGGCPWDKEQTHDSMKSSLLEECYELVEAIEKQDLSGLMEEVGDVILNAFFHINIAEEQMEFRREDMFGFLISKLVRRHPHVFSDVVVDGPEQVLKIWDELKSAERGGKGESMLESVPKVMPALSYAQTIQRRAARVGFDWPEFDGVLDKITEEINELRNADSLEKKREEMGDLLFSIVNASRWLDLDAEDSLRSSNTKFFKRFAYMETIANARGVALKEIPLGDKEMLWLDAKANITDEN